MKTENDTNHSDESIDLTDVLLREHSRLGSGPDSDLVNSILAATVDRKLDLPQPAERPSFSWKEWAKLAALVTVFAGLTVGVLKQLPGLAPAEEPTFQLTVRFASSVDEALELADNSIPNKKAGIVRDTAEVDVYNAKSGMRTESFAISANMTDRSSKKLEYSGDVTVDHASFSIQADRLVVAAANSDKQTGGAFQAYGAVIKRTLENGDVEIARADELTYEPAEQSLVLSGESMELTAGNQTLVFASIDTEKLILRPDGYQIVRR